MKPYLEVDGIALYLGDCREVLPALALQADVAICDPPYGATALAWDRWPTGWVEAVGAALKPAGSLWCFGSMRMFLDHRDDFAAWKLAQYVVWEKQNGSGFDVDRFKRVHEFALHWYRDRWQSVHRSTPRIAGEARPTAKIRDRAAMGTRGAISEGGYDYGETRIARSVIRVANCHVANCHGYAENETQKPEGLVRPLVESSAPRRGLLLYPFAGSGTDLVVARSLGIRAVGVEVREQQCEVIARRLAQRDLATAIGGAL